MNKEPQKPSASIYESPPRRPLSRSRDETLTVDAVMAMLCADPADNHSFRVMLVLEEALIEYNWEHGDPGEPELTNVVRYLSVHHLAVRCSLSETETTEALNRLNAKGWVETSWLVGVPENNELGYCHAHKLPHLISDTVVITYNAALRRWKEKQNDVRQQWRDYRKAKKASKEVAR